MSFVKKYFLWIVLIIAIGVWGYVYVNRKGPCETPLKYSLGTFDTRFAISKSDFLDAISQADQIWESTNLLKPGEKFFQFDPNNSPGDLTINLIYDSRQQLVDQNKSLDTKINQTEQSADTIKKQFSSLQTQYNQAKNEYTTLLNQYQEQGSDSENLRNSLEEKRLQVNSLADQINALIKKYNYLVTSANSTISVVNQTANQEFEEGEYITDQSGQRINIYEFEDKPTLVRVLAHELGHSLGLNHNANPDSIMYYLNSSKNIKPTVDDVDALKVVCQIK